MKHSDEESIPSDLRMIYKLGKQIKANLASAILAVVFYAYTSYQKELVASQIAEYAKEKDVLAIVQELRSESLAWRQSHERLNTEVTLRLEESVDRTSSRLMALESMSSANNQLLGEIKGELKRIAH